MQRRDFLKLMGLASSSTLIPSCDFKKETEKLIPYLLPPEEEIIPGQAFYYKATCTECPASCGISVKVCEKVFNDIRGIYPVRLKKPLIKDSSGNFKGVEWGKAFSLIVDAMKKSGKEGDKSISLSGRT